MPPPAQQPPKVFAGEHHTPVNDVRDKPRRQPFPRVCHPIVAAEVHHPADAPAQHPQFSPLQYQPRRQQVRINSKSAKLEQTVKFCFWHSDGVQSAGHSSVFEGTPGDGDEPATNESCTNFWRYLKLVLLALLWFAFTVCFLPLNQVL